MTAARPLASVSLDLDDLWAYLRTHGDAAWVRRPSYLPTVVPLLLDVLGDLGLTITFFIVGEDAARPANGAVLARLAERGHEIANHSFAHETWLQRYSRQQLEDDIGRAEAAIAACTGEHPRGFRGPGFSWSPTLLDVLARRGYLYDASTLPTYLAPLARWYFLATARLSREERKEREGLFGSARDGFRSLKPYRWRLAEERSLLEIPVTTIPVIKVPFHMSYLLYLARFSHGLMFAYLRGAIAACRATGVQPSFLLHPLDVLGREDVPELSFFPGMDMPRAEKIQLFTGALRMLAKHFTIVPMRAHARALVESVGLAEHPLAPAALLPPGQAAVAHGD